MAKKSPSARTIDLCRLKGWDVDTVERTVRGNGIVFKRDLWGLIDQEALDGLPGVLGIQTTDHTNVAKHIAKALDADHIAVLRRFLEAGNRFQVWGWHSKKGTLRLVHLVLDADKVVHPVEYAPEDEPALAT